MRNSDADFGESEWNSLAFARLEGMESLAFGHRFNQVMDTVTWPSGLQSLAIARCLDQAVATVILPGSLQRLIFGFASSSHGHSGLQTLLSGLQSFNSADIFDQDMDCDLPSSSRSFVSDGNFNQAMDDATSGAGAFGRRDAKVH